MEKYDNKYEKTREKEHEIFFCKNYSHRFITHFYEFNEMYVSMIFSNFELVFSSFYQV